MIMSLAEFMFVVFGTILLMGGLTALILYFELKEIIKEKAEARELAKAVAEWNSYENEMKRLERQAIFFINMKEVEKEFKEM